MRRSTVVRAILAAGACSCAFAASAQAYELDSFGVGLTDPGTKLRPTPGASQLRAGAHPDLTVDLRFPTKPGDGSPDQSIKIVDTNLPRGMVFNPTVAAQCKQEDLAEVEVPYCPVASQIGTADIQDSRGGGFNDLAVYNMEPPPGVPAQFGFSVFKTAIKLDGAVRTGGDYGLSARARNIPQTLPLARTRVTFWGVPADPVHDADRRSLDRDGNYYVNIPAGLPARPLISNPGRCTGAPSLFTADAASWETPSPLTTRTTYNQRLSGEPFAFTGCEELAFLPSVSVKPTTSAPDSPTGLDVDVRVPQSADPRARATAHVKELSLLLPEGMNVNPSAAQGLTSCAPSEIALSSPAPAACPGSSSIGTVTIDTPLLSQPLTGHAFLAKQGDNPFGSTLAMYLTAERDGAVVKLAGRIDADPSTGRLRVTFADNPELPFSSLRVSLDGGPSAPLTTPASCGTQSVEGTATPWSGSPSKPVGSSFSIDCTAGLGGFAPGFLAGTQSPTAGLFSPLSVRVSRPDGQQQIKDLTFELPPGLLAKLKGVPFGSRVGTAKVTAGAGPTPFALTGDVTLTGPYKGAPYGFSTRVRVVAGPLDLGSVVVRQALFIDPSDTRVRVVSDPLPTILSGIPVRLRTLDVNVDRPGFTVNPTSCSQKAVRGRIGSASGQQAGVAVRFQVGGCPALDLTPKLALRLSGKGAALRDGGHPSLRAILTQPSKQSNLKRAEVTLPSSLALDPDNAQTLCEFAEGRKADPKCPKGSIVGRAKAVSPLLGQTLSGPVYFVKNIRRDARTGREIRALPTLVVPLKGGGVQITLRAKTAVAGSKLKTTFDPIPDAAVSRFDLALNGGGNGILVANSSVCSKSRALDIGIRGHNGELARSTPTLAASCK